MIIKLDNVERAELLKAWTEGAIDTSKFPSMRDYLIDDRLLPPINLEEIKHIVAEIFKLDLLKWLEEKKSSFDAETYLKVKEVVKETEPKEVFF